MYSHKNLKCGFIILCAEHNSSLLKSTLKSIKSRYNLPIICVTDDSATNTDLKEMKEICTTYKSKSTFSSLLNTGMQHAPADWNIIICAGSTVKAKMDERFSFFVESEKDVLYPIADRKTHFVDATLNGLFINKKTWKEVGKMKEDGDFETVKLIWCLEAINKGVQFKAIAGTKIC